MLEINGSRYGSCDGIDRRSFLRIGALGLGGLTLPGLLKARAAGEAASNGKAVIQVFLGGGLTHIDSYDPKPEAPAEFRGEFAAIPTAIPGVQLCELFPRQARLMDKVAIVRSLQHGAGDHEAGQHWVMTGFRPGRNLPNTNERPSTGSVAARLHGANAPGVPPYVGIPDAPAFGGAAYLGPGFNPFGLGGDPAGDFKLRNLEPAAGLSLSRLGDRRSLLGRLDRIRRERDASGTMEGIDRFTTQAYDMVLGDSARRAFDLGREDPKVRERYGNHSLGQGCLLARRLVEAGVAFVTISHGNWDHHGDIFTNCRNMLPPVDRAIAALVDDLSSRGLDRDVLLVVWGEFGRTPRVNNNKGRDHWPGAMSALLAGGGLKMGQVVGATASKGEHPIEAPCGPEDLIRTIYHVLGIDPRHEFANASGRPMPVLNQGRPIAALI